MPWWCSGQGCGAQRLRSKNRFLAWALSPLNNVQVSWLKSERKGLGKIEKSRWCSGPRALLRWFQSGRNRLGRIKKIWLFSNWHGGVMVKAVVHQAQGGEDRFPESTFKFVSEAKKKALGTCNRFEELNK